MQITTGQAVVIGLIVLALILSRGGNTGGYKGDVIENGVNSVNQQYENLQLPSRCGRAGGCLPGEKPTSNYRCEAWHAMNQHLSIDQCPH